MSDFGGKLGGTFGPLASTTSLIPHHAKPVDHCRAPVQAGSPGREDRSNRSLNNEWVEIANTTRNPISLRGWTLRRNDGNRYRFDNVRQCHQRSRGPPVARSVLHPTVPPRGACEQPRFGRLWTNGDSSVPNVGRSGVPAAELLSRSACPCWSGAGRRGTCTRASCGRQ
ncbi:lamin tail domain-containing protein [Streptomyces sp. NPDC058412]|uniref:lamin tail domain-containing protein n=1 Tax=Streptomyces sp. NPDC058412 TaxID=3346486 RepID=UPI003648B8E2